MDSQIGISTGGSLSNSEKNGLVLSTIDGGRNWNEKMINVGTEFRSSQIINKSVAFAVGGTKIIKLSDIWSKLETKLTDSLEL